MAAKDPDAALHDQLRAGSVQLSSALESIQEALETAKNLQKSTSGDVKDALGEAADYLDSAGSGVAEIAEEPPALAEVKAKFAEYDDKRLKSIETANDCLTDILQALDLMNALADAAPAKLKPAYEKAADLVDVAATDLESAIEALGGKVETPQEPDSTER